MIFINVELVCNVHNLKLFYFLSNIITINEIFLIFHIIHTKYKFIKHFEFRGLSDEGRSILILLDQKKTQQKTTTKKPECFSGCK